MNRLQENRPIWHAVAWIAIYVIAVNIGDWLSTLVGVPNSGASAVLVLLAVWLVVRLRKHGWLTYYGVRPLRRRDFNATLLYIPLLLVALMQFTKGFRDDLSFTTVALIIVLMVGVGFLEELIFRGMLFRGIQRTSTLPRAVVISGVTFGIGHIVNLTRGMAPLDQAIQIAFGVTLGIVLALLFAVTGTIVPLIAFHALLNISGNLTRADAQAELVMLAATTLVCAGYAGYLITVLRRRGPSPEISQPAPRPPCPHPCHELQLSPEQAR